MISDKFTYDRISLMNDLEAFLYHTNKKYIKDFPITRIQIGYFLEMFNLQMINQANISKEINFKKHPVNLQSFVRLVKLYVKLFFLRTRNKNSLRNKVLLFGFAEHFKKQINGEDVNLYLSPIKTELTRNGLEFEELLISNNHTKTEVTSISEFYDVLNEYNYLLFSFKAKLFNRYKEIVMQAKCINDFLSKNSVPENVHCVNVFYNAKVSHEISYHTFKQFIKIVKPRLIWTYVYYDNRMLAMCKAANYNKIPIVEYQHSQQSDIHFAYAKWNRTDNYCEYFPSIFWVWAREDAERIRKNFVTQKYNPKIIIGGNIAVIQQQQIFNYKEPGASKGILISLTGGWIPDFLENIIENDTEYKWYFRSHPRYPQDAERLAVFKKKFPEKIETEIANKLSLFELFTFVTINITDASGTVLEAEHFGIKNIVTSDDGKVIFREKIESGKFFSVSNEKELSEILYEEALGKVDHSKNQNSLLCEKLNNEVSNLFMVN